MSETFTIGVEGGPEESDDDLNDCRYEPGSDHVRPGIYVARHSKYMNAARCHAILRKLAELSDEKPTSYGRNHPWQEDKDEEGLEKMLWELRKAKYQKKSMTPDERLKKIANIVHNSNGEAYALANQIKNVLEDK